jgi:hypothetical protein
MVQIVFYQIITRGQIFHEKDFDLSAFDGLNQLIQIAEPFEEDRGILRPEQRLVRITLNDSHHERCQVFEVFHFQILSHPYQASDSQDWFGEQEHSFSLGSFEDQIDHVGLGTLNKAQGFRKGEKFNVEPQFGNLLDGSQYLYGDAHHFSTLVSVDERWIEITTDELDSLRKTDRYQQQTQQNCQPSHKPSPYIDEFMFILSDFTTRCCRVLAILW